MHALCAKLAHVGIMSKTLKGASYIATFNPKQCQ